MHGIFERLLRLMHFLQFLFPFFVAISTFDYFLCVFSSIHDLIVDNILVLWTTFIVSLSHSSQFALSHTHSEL